MTEVLVEVAVDSLPGARVALEAGAGRLELCAGLGEGGVTPSVSLVEAVLALSDVPVFVLVRPRPGSFVLAEGEAALVEADIRRLMDLGVPGVVVGALDAQGSVDRSALELWRRAATGASLTFHRAFDLVPDPVSTWAALDEAGVDRVLTCGGGTNVEDGLEGLRALSALGGPALLPGGGVRADLRERLLAATGSRELHTSARTASSERWSAGAFGDLVLPDPREIQRLRMGD